MPPMPKAKITTKGEIRITGPALKTVDLVNILNSKVPSGAVPTIRHESDPRDHDEWTLITWTMVSEA
jgi:hypothetical protein